MIDPLYTLPFLIFLILAMLQKRTAKKRRVYNNLGLIVSSSYLALTLLLKWIAFTKFESALMDQNIAYKQIDTRPSPMNTILWSANIETEDAYLLGYYSFFDTQPITFEAYKKNHELLGDLAEDEKVQQMIAISKGWYTIINKDNKLLFSDLRFGLLSMDKGAQNFVFQYEIVRDEHGQVQFVEQEKSNLDGKKLMSDLWVRIKGN